MGENGRHVLTVEVHGNDRLLRAVEELLKCIEEMDVINRQRIEELEEELEEALYD